MVTIGLICEGITDHIVIKHIIAGYLGNYDISVSELQPKVNPTDEHKSTPGNWDQVFKYCQSSDFEEGLNSNPSLYVIIHLDSDVFRTKEVPRKYWFEFNNTDGTALNTEEIIDNIKGLLIKNIGTEIYNAYANRILFAIAVNETECWLLPFYETGKQRSKEVNCLNTLNKKIAAKLPFTIAKKEPKYYVKVAQPLLKQKHFLKLYTFNPSLEIFCQQLEDLPIEKEPES